MARSTVPMSLKNGDDIDMHQYYLDVIDCMPNIVYLLDKNCCLMGCNRNFRSLLGVNQLEEMIGVHPYKKLVALADWSEERSEILKKDDIHVLVSGEPVYDATEAPVVNKNGDIVYYLSTRIPLYNKDKQVIGLVCILTDITETRKLKEQLAKIKKELQAYNQKQEPEELTAARNDSLENLIEKKPPRVLMVEDNSVAQRATQALLMQLDCHVDVAESGDKATTLFAPGKYDLVFMDIGLEDTSGYVVSKRIRQLEQGTEHHVPIIALTGYQADIVKYDCDDYSMEGALTKPLTTEQAKQIIQHYIYHIDIPVRGLKSIKGQEGNEKF
ncbi:MULTISPECIES: response regulator [Legionella]|uniref:Sensory box sensor histidine kinase/response regulator n=1 Tax=Legionella maceachernii TaxID=466 RepID=A0A0W0WC49_9GAMM|nr:response regulator [Legionella maceachernii]KTD29806.1 sensory box sensor histidine kinase/response regulator [Legionella maceachernii]SJZ79092.1 PAS domain S-box-containing protein [Legionella maceachernii]SUP02929.1 Autoinducer 1 sensor kinase/phosphatase luxN [Legionella maceachernii]